MLARVACARVRIIRRIESRRARTAESARVSGTATFPPAVEYVAAPGGLGADVGAAPGTVAAVDSAEVAGTPGVANVESAAAGAAAEESVAEPSGVAIAGVGTVGATLGGG